VDGSGCLDPVEVSQAAVELGFPLDETQIKEAFAAMDTDGDGTISREEFANWWNGQGDEDALRQAFNKEMSLSLEKAGDGQGALMG